MATMVVVFGLAFSATFVPAFELTPELRLGLAFGFERLVSIDRFGDRSDSSVRAGVL